VYLLDTIDNTRCSSQLQPFAIKLEGSNAVLPCVLGQGSHDDMMYNGFAPDFPAAGVGEKAIVRRGTVFE
jgi:hypothetical protein